MDHLFLLMSISLTVLISQCKSTKNLRKRC
nr:MAG TPA_asm: hypothetical protein [Caudoviricetes sp.]